MPGVGIINRTPSILRAGAGLPYPTEGLEIQLLNSTYEDGGTTYYRNLLGQDIPVVGTDGGDDILDFSIFNDDRFDKGAVVGNSLGLPEYYNSPLDDYFYYDDTSQTTRRYWKLKDFHYFYVQRQTDITPRLLNNEFFLKAKATTDTSNVIDSISELLIYSTEQTDNNLSKLRKYIGIQDDFEINIYDFGGFITDSWIARTGGSIDSEYTISGNGAFTNNKIFASGVKYRLLVASDDFSNVNSFYGSGSSGTDWFYITSDFEDNIFVAGGDGVVDRGIVINTSGQFTVETICVCQIYENYYKS
jgi:hypothetical protein